MGTHQGRPDDLGESRFVSAIVPSRRRGSMAPNNRLHTAGCGPVRHISRASLRADHSSGPWTDPDGRETTHARNDDPMDMKDLRCILMRGRSYRAQTTRTTDLSA